MLRHLRFIGFLGLSCLLHAQEFRSTLAGRVVDQTGAVVAGAKIQATETTTNSRYDTVTNTDGLYTFPSSSQQLSDNCRTFPGLCNNLRIDSMNNIDLDLTKSFVIHENLKVQFRAESYNLCNRPLFESPNMTVTASTFAYIIQHDQLAARHSDRAASDFLR
jgi:hypothetical protein